jgi:MoaA/NifB/PqqE/SkfB family radical SAM enzyme
MDVAVILTYRCNSKCSMCHIWQNPTHPQEEVTLETLSKIPDGVDFLNLTGGEPTLREDLHEIVDLLHPKAMKVEISTNGLGTAKLEPIIRKYPDIKVRYSMEGMGLTNDSIRGEKGGFDEKVAGLLKLKELGGCDLGFAITIQDDNVSEVCEVYHLAQEHGFELATSTLHNGFQFHKGDNIPYDRVAVAKSIEGLIVEMLRTNDVKTWFRAYLNLGLMRKALGHPRMLPCTAGTDFIFIDPWSDVYACNVRPDLLMGNLWEQDWEELVHSDLAEEVRGKVARCTQNCWMVGSAKTAMRYSLFPQIPRLRPSLWVLENKIKATLGIPLHLERYVDFENAYQDDVKPKRIFFLDKKAPRNLQKREDKRYQKKGPFFNR